MLLPRKNIVFGRCRWVTRGNANTASAENKKHDYNVFFQFTAFLHLFNVLPSHIRNYMKRQVFFPSAANALVSWPAVQVLGPLSSPISLQSIQMLSSGL